LFQVVDPAVTIDIPDDIRQDMNTFLKAMETEEVDLKNLGIRGEGLDAILAELRRLYAHD